MKLEEYVGKDIRIKQKSNHPHAGENGTVLRIDSASHVGKGLVIKEEKFGEEFFVFDTKQIQILK